MRIVAVEADNGGLASLELHAKTKVDREMLLVLRIALVRWQRGDRCVRWGDSSLTGHLLQAIEEREEAQAR